MSKPDCCAYAAEFDRIYASKRATDEFLRMLFKPTPGQAERQHSAFHSHLNHIANAWRRGVLA